MPKHPFALFIQELERLHDLDPDGCRFLVIPANFKDTFEASFAFPLFHDVALALKRAKYSGAFSAPAFEDLNMLLAEEDHFSLVSGALTWLKYHGHDLYGNHDTNVVGKLAKAFKAVRRSPAR
jgi:hypothetical protein